MSKSTLEVVIEPPAGSADRARSICAAHGNRPDELLEIFHDLQHELGYIPDLVLPVIANALNRSRAEIYGVLTFIMSSAARPAAGTTSRSAAPKPARRCTRRRSAAMPRRSSA